VTGKVTSSDDGTGLPGVNVIEKGTNNGTATDADGNFSLSVPQTATLVFSFVGYESQEMAVGSQTSVNISLASDVTSLSEVVVVGYGSQEKKEITGSVVSIDAKDFNRGNINDPSQLLQGKVAGLSIYNKGGDPNTGATIRLRGISTIGANASPLIVIDGVLGASLENVDPNDIESVNVLKDGSAAAIYGSRGSSGVILVTTKKGTKSGIGVTYNGYVSAASVFKAIPVMTASEYVAAGGNDLGSRTDWQDLVTQTGVSNVHNIALSGGGDKTSFRLSTNIRDVNGILKNSGFDQLNSRASISHSGLDNRLKVEANMALTNKKFSRSFNEALRYATLFNPTAPVRFDNGDYYQAILFDNFNPVAIIDQNINEGSRRTFNFGGKVDFTVVKNLTLTANYGIQNESELRGEYYSINSFFRGLNRHGLARRETSENRFTLFEGYGNYAINADRLAIDITGGYSYQQDDSQSMFIAMGNFPSDERGYHALEDSKDRLTGPINKIDVSSERSPVNKIIAFFGRVNLTFDDAIFFNASLRREGSTKLGTNNQWGVFPSVGAGVDLNKYIQSDAASVLKLRVGYGVTGSLPPGSGYSLEEYDYDPANGAVSPTRAANPNLKWEQKAELNAGLDFGVAAGKLTGALDVYSRNITDLILLRTPEAGEQLSAQIYDNVGALRTNGIELNLNYNSIKVGALSWTPGLVASHYKSVLKDYFGDNKEFMQSELGAPGQNGTNMVRVALDEEIGQIWGPVFAGVEDNGAPRFADLNGDGVVTSAQAEALNDVGDFKKLGNGLPTVELGWSNSLTYKHWDFNVFFRGAFGHSLVNNYRAFYEPIDPGAINSYNRVKTDKAVAGLTSAQFSSLYVEKANFVKLDNISIGYNFPMTGAIKNLRLYATGQNVFQITNYTGIDPEPVLADPGPSDNGGFLPANPNVLAPGIDRRNNYFTARTFTFGLNIGF
jgi:iron complex outermembrane receptor protein